jgi:ketosteroid isomerase-like protein
MVRLLTFAALSAVLISPACRETSAPPDRRGMEARNLHDFETAWNRDFQRLDVERLVSRYTSDAILQLPNAPPASGSQAIREVWKSAVQDSNFSMLLENSRLEVSRSGDLAFSQGSYTASMTDAVTSKKMREAGTYVMVYRRGPGSGWLVVSDIRSQGAPPAEAQ